MTGRGAFVSNARMIAPRQENEPDDDLDLYVVLEAASDLVAMLIESMPEELRVQVEEWLEQCED